MIAADRVFPTSSQNRPPKPITADGAAWITALTYKASPSTLPWLAGSYANKKWRQSLEKLLLVTFVFMNYNQLISHEAFVLLWYHFFPILFWPSYDLNSWFVPLSCGHALFEHWSSMKLSVFGLPKSSNVVDQPWKWVSFWQLSISHP